MDTTGTGKEIYDALMRNCMHEWEVKDSDPGEYVMSICKKCGAFRHQDLYNNEETIEPGYAPHEYHNHVRNDAQQPTPARHDATGTADGIALTTVGALYDADKHTITFQFSQEDFLRALQFGIRVADMRITLHQPQPSVAPTPGAPDWSATKIRDDMDVDTSAYDGLRDTSVRDTYFRADQLKPGMHVGKYVAGRYVERGVVKDINQHQKDGSVFLQLNDGKLNLGVTCASDDLWIVPADPQPVTPSGAVADATTDAQPPATTGAAKAGVKLSASLAKSWQHACKQYKDGKWVHIQRGVVNSHGELHWKAFDGLVSAGLINKNGTITDLGRQLSR